MVLSSIRKKYGITEAACKCLPDRFFIGIEIDKAYCDLAKKIE